MDFFLPNSTKWEDPILVRLRSQNLSPTILLKHFLLQSPSKQVSINEGEKNVTPNTGEGKKTHLLILRLGGS